MGCLHYAALWNIILLMEETDIIPGAEVDWHDGQAITGCSDKQVSFVQALMKGANKTQAAREAGYRGEGSTLRSSASQLAKSHKVKALLAWAKAGGAGLTDVPGDVDELKKILWRHARGSDKNASLRATEVIHKLEAQERESAAQHGGSSLETLNEIAEIAPVFAAMLADHNDVDWKPPSLAISEMRAEIERMRVVVARLSLKSGPTAPDENAVVTKAVAQAAV